MRLISWNMERRLGEDLAGQADAIAGAQPDVVALLGVGAASDPDWLERLAAIGLMHAISSTALATACGRARGNLLVSRWPLLAWPAHEFEVPYPESIVSAVVCTPATAVEVHVAHMPTGVEEKVATVEGVYARLARTARRPRILCGDFDARERSILEGLAGYDLADVSPAPHAAPVFASAKLGPANVGAGSPAVVEFAAIPSGVSEGAAGSEPPAAAEADRDALPTPAEGTLPPPGMQRLAAFADRIRALPDGPLERASVATDAFRLHDAPGFRIYYAPFDWTNRRARISLIGLTPDWRQAQQAFEAARDVLAAGGSVDDAGHAVKAQASFAGMRERLVGWLDGIGLGDALGLGSTAVLFGDAIELLHATSVVRYPVFSSDGSHWSGRSPALLETPGLLSYVDDVLGPELAEVPGALVIPLGATAWQAVRRLIDQGRIDRERCLRGVPHPSMENASGPARYELERERLASAVAAWAAGRPGQAPPRAAPEPPPPAARPMDRRPTSLDARLPGTERLEALLVEALASFGGAATQAAIIDRAIELGRFTPAQRTLPGPPSKRDQYPDMLSYRLNWALTRLSLAGGVTSQADGVWRLVEA